MMMASSSSVSIGRCISCGRRISRAGCPEHGQVDSSSTVPDDDALAGEIGSTAPSFPGYRVERILGQGGFGTVYRARRADGTLVAIKQSRPDIEESSARLLREAEVLSAVKPPHVPAVLEHGAFADGTQFMVMEFIGAPSLAEHLQRRGTFPIAECLAIIAAILQPLAAVHAQGYLHRDLKPENVLYDASSGRAVLIDFGLSRMERGMPVDSFGELTSEGALVGTTDYMAPEQHEGRLDLDASADVYALGIMLFEMLTGRVPFFGPQAVVREHHRSQRPSRPSLHLPSISPELEEIILRCLAKAPGDRFPNAPALASAIEIARRNVLPVERNSAQAMDPPPSRRGNRARSELRMVCVLSFVSPLDGIALRRYLEPKGAQIVHMSAERCIVAFGHGIDTNPARCALVVARALLAERRAHHLMIDVKQVAIRFTATGRDRIMAPHLRQIPFPDNAAPDEIFISDTARMVLDAVETLHATPPISASLTGETFGASSSRTPPSHGAILFGRDTLLEALVSAANHVVEATCPSMVIVIAESGYGKSQIRRALSTRLQTTAPTVILVNVQAQAPTDGNAHGCVRELLLGALGLPALIPQGSWLELLESRLGSAANPAAIATLALAIGWMTPGSVHGAWSEGCRWRSAAPHVQSGESDIARALAGLEAAPGAIRTQLIATAARALRQRARQTPLFIVVDDAHFADDATIAILDHATRGDESAPIFVCALGRPTFVEIHPAFGTRAGYREVHHVGALDSASASSFCRELLRPVENVPASAIDRIVERAQAIPLLMVELVRGIKAAGLVRTNPSGGGHYLATDELERLPELPLIEWLVHRELDGLPEGARAHAQLAAVLGLEVTNAELEGVHEWLDRAGLGQEFPLDARVGSERLVALGIFRRAGPDRYRFRHALLRDAIARTVADDVRPSVHHAAVDHWRSVDSPNDSVALAKLAHHAARAGDKALAETTSLALAESARTRHNFLEAERWYSEALENAAVNSEHQGPALRGRALMRYRLGRYSDARLDLGFARKLAESMEDRFGEAEILLDEATILDWMGEHAASASCVTQAFDKVSQCAVPPLLEARLLLGRGRSLHRASYEKEARAMLERALEIAEPLGEEAYETRMIALLMSGYILQGLARLEDAARALDRAIATCEAHGDLLHLASAVNNRAHLAAFLGDKPGMIKDFDRVIELGRHLGQDAIQIAGHYNMAEFLYLWGDIEEATPHAERALQLELQRTSNAPRMEVELLSARMALHRGDLAHAGKIVAFIRERKRATMPSPAVDVLCTAVEYACGDVHDAAWEALDKRSAQFSIGQERIEVLEARAVSALRRGLADDARQHFVRALDAARSIPNVMRERLDDWMCALSVDQVSGA